MPSYTTLQQVRKQRGVLNSTSADQDLADLIIAASQMVEDICGYNFDCRIFEQTFNGEVGAINPTLSLDNWPLLEATTVLNGNGDELTSDQYVLLPKGHTYPKTHIRLAEGYYWLAPNSAPGSATAPAYSPLLDVAYAEDALSITGKWGFHRNYGSAWKRSTLVVGTGGIDNTSTTLPITGSNFAYDVFPRIDVGHVIRIDTEYLLVTGPVENTQAATALTVERAYNGSQAAAHTAATVIDVWSVEPVIELATRETVVAAYGARSNPSGETLEAPGGYRIVTVDVPKRVLDKLVWPYFNPARGQPR